MAFNLSPATASPGGAGALSRRGQHGGNPHGTLRVDLPIINGDFP